MHVRFLVQTFLRVSRLLSAMLSALALSPIAAQAADLSAATATVYTGMTLLDGISDDPVENATLVVIGRQISAISTGQPSPSSWPPGARVVDLSSGSHFMTPGFIDAHVHFRDFSAARRALESGVTTARALGGWWYKHVGMRDFAARGLIESPEIVASGSHIRNRMPEDMIYWDDSLIDLLEPGIHGPEAVSRLGRAQLARGVDVLKIGGDLPPLRLKRQPQPERWTIEWLRQVVSTRMDGFLATDPAPRPPVMPMRAMFDTEEVRALVAVGAPQNVPVAVHAHGDAQSRAAIEGGARSLEHGTEASLETLQMAAEAGIYLVPTVDVRVSAAEQKPKNQIYVERSRAMVVRAHEAGAILVAATDSYYDPDNQTWIADEVVEFVNLGIDPMDALRAATSVSAALLQVDDHTGRIAAGLDADLLLFAGNPLDDPALLARPLLVVSDGRVVVDRLSPSPSP